MRIVAPIVLTTVAAGSVRDSPVTRVVELIKGLRSEIEKDGKAEQKTYDKFACWCEDTTARKSAAISEARDTIEELSKRIVQTKGTLATLKVDISQLKKDIAANIKSQEEATALRQKEHDDYAASRTETEQATAALKGAVEVLAGAGTGRKSALQEAQTLSVVAGIKNALRILPKDSMDNSELDMVRSFVNNPEEFGSKKSESFLQMHNNPFGDYAPASTQIQGILKDMYDQFTSNMQNWNEEEGTRQKSFEELIQTKKEELAALKATLANKNASHGEATKSLADDKTRRSNTEAQLKEDEIFFADTKESCAAKADEWAERTRLRTEELGGIGQALKTLTSDDAKAIFDSSANTMFIEVSSKNIKKNQALAAIKSIAKKTHSLRLATLFSNMKTGGHFDDILGEVDRMIQNLREEEKDDIEHRDFCQESQNKLGGQEDSLNHTKENKEAKRERLSNKSDSLQTEADNTTKAKEEQLKAMEDALNTRNEEHAEYIQALKDDQDAVVLLAKAIGQMSAFYSNNKIALLGQPSYKDQPDKAPETFGDKPYGGRKSESTGVFAILEMIKEDIQKEIGESKEAEKDATKEYEKMRAAGRANVQTLNDLINSLMLEKAQTDQKIGALDGDLEDLGAQLEGNASENDAMKKNCNWIETSFDSRRQKRIAEINGLQTAKSFLLGADA